MLQLLYQALGSKLGILVQVSDAARVRQKLYAARRQSGDPSLDILSIHQSPYSPMELFIVRRYNAQERSRAA